VYAAIVQLYILWERPVCVEGLHLQSLNMGNGNGKWGAINSNGNNGQFVERFLRRINYTLAPNWTSLCMEMTTTSNDHGEGDTWNQNSRCGWMGDGGKSLENVHRLSTLERKAKRQQGVTCDKIELETCLKSKINKLPESVSESPSHRATKYGRELAVSFPPSPFSRLNVLRRSPACM